MLLPDVVCRHAELLDVDGVYGCLDCFVARLGHHDEDDILLYQQLEHLKGDVPPVEQKLDVIEALEIKLPEGGCKGQGVGDVAWEHPVMVS